MSTVTKSALADIFGVTERTITEWMNLGMPVLSRNAGRGGNQYETRDCIEWRIYNVLESDSLSLQRERARLAKEQADAQEYKNAITRSELVPTDLVMTHFTDALKTLNARLAGVGNQTASRVIGLDKMPLVAAEIDGGVRDALAAVTPSVLFAAMGLTPGVAAAAETDAESVGGHLPSAEFGERSGTGPVEVGQGGVSARDT